MCRYDKPPSIEERQKQICGVQLIPIVPDDVRTTFRRAKDAYIFGYFRYDFFTVAVHYAGLALEAAVKARWSANRPLKVAVSCGTDTAEMHFPSHTRTYNLCLKRGWRGRKVRVDSKPFPSSMNALLNWLEGEQIVTK